MALSLKAISAMTSHGARQLGEARAQLSWEAAMEGVPVRVP
jgi:hypothetical protein